MLKPKFSKFNKFFRGKIYGSENKVINLCFGFVGIKVLKSIRVSSKQLECLKVTLLNKIKCKIWIRIFPSLGLSFKPAELRMGKGKGNIAYWCYPLNAGRIIIELQVLSNIFNIKIKKIGKSKLGVKIKLIFL
jgi:large subunit ribosomal protein L16